MESKSRLELYREFIEFVQHDFRGERKIVSRRMFSVFLWCFLFPAITTLAVIVLIKFRVLPLSVRRYLDWVVLMFPIFFSLYVLGSEVLRGIPGAFRSGALGNTLGQAVKETEWREKICQELSTRITSDLDQWQWVMMNFRIDLKAMQFRTRFLTVFAGAVFFLLMQGIDSLGGGERSIQFWSFQGWFESSTDTLAQFVGLALFLVLFYVSGSQTYYSLVRYLDCLELMTFSEAHLRARAVSKTDS